MEAKLIKKEYLVEDGDRCANIVFLWDEGKKRMVFAHCSYNGVSTGYYSLKDWEFLQGLSIIILRRAVKERTVKEKDVDDVL